MEMVSALQKAHVGVQEASMEGKPQLHHRDPRVPPCRKAPGPIDCAGRAGMLPWEAGGTPALATPDGHPSFSQLQGKARLRVAFSPWEQYSQGMVFSADWLFIPSGVGDAVNDVERGCKMG